MAIKEPPHTKEYLVRTADGKEIERVKLPRALWLSLQPLFLFPGFVGATAEGRVKLHWEMTSSSIVEEIGTYIITHPDLLSPELRSSMRRDIELPEWLGI